MTPSYVVRLWLLSSAVFLLVQLFLGALIASIASWAVRRAQSMAPRRAAQCLLTLRLLPAASSAIIVALLCVPSYLRFEPRVASGEEIGFVCLAAAILGAGVCIVAISRALKALIRTALFLRRYGGARAHNGLGLALAGIFQPRLLISKNAIDELSSDQLAVALRHEHAHRVSRDNLKRLLILLAPAMFPGIRALERAWAKCAEWAADDRAAENDADRPALAAALVRVARLQSGLAMPPLVTSLVEADGDLAVRVNRLLHAAPVNVPGRRVEAIMLSAFIVIAAIDVTPGALRIVHSLLERLLD